MVVIRDELGDMKAESLHKYELLFKTSSRKNLGYRTKRQHYSSFGRENRKKIPKYSLSWCGKGAKCHWSHFTFGQHNSQWTDRSLYKGEVSETKGNFSSLPITIKRNTLFTCPLL